MTTLDYLIESNEKIVAKGLSEENVEELRACWQEYKNERAAGRESVELKEILRLDDLILHYKRDKSDDKAYVYMLGRALAALHFTYASQRARK